MKTAETQSVIGSRGAGLEAVVEPEAYASRCKKETGPLLRYMEELRWKNHELHTYKRHKGMASRSPSRDVRAAAKSNTFKPTQVE